MKVCEHITFSGHRNISATHKTTFEITKSKSLTKRGDCIIGVAADKACADLDQRIKDALRKGGVVHLTICVGDLSFKVRAEGSPQLMLTDEEDIVVRRSSYICPRTLAVKANAAACDIPRPIVDLLRSEGCRGYLLIEVESK
jgi:hypothetical protein